MQIHVILSIVHPNDIGEVDCEYFLRVACTVIPSMFDAGTFMDKAATIYKEKQDAQAKAELEELQGLTGPLSTKRRGADDEDQEDVQANAPDREAVEQQLRKIVEFQVGGSANSNSVHVAKFLEAMHHESVAQCQLWESELHGFIAEAEIDERGEIAYHEHIKVWVPIMFELRRSRVYDAITSKDWSLDAQQLIDLSEYEKEFPMILPYDDDDQRPGSQNSRRRPSLGKNIQRRPSSRQLRHSRSSTKEGIDHEQIHRMSRRNTGDKSSKRPQSRGDKRPKSRDGDHRRPASRAGSTRSLQRSNSTCSQDSNYSQKSNASRR